MVLLLRLLSFLSHTILIFRKNVIRIWARVTYLNPTLIWLLRWRLRSAFSFNPRESQTPNLGEIPVTYINLDRRPDRAEQIVREFSRLRLGAPERFPAVEDDNPMLGAAKSHLAVLENFASSSLNSLIMVCEDDLIFSGSRAELERAVQEFANDPRLDVLCLAYMIKNTTRAVKGKEVRAREHLLISNQILTQACYVLKPSAVTPIIRSLRQSVRLLSAGVQWSYAAGDVYWQTLQQGRLFFAYPEKRLARQSAGHSDIWSIYKDLNV